MNLEIIYINYSLNVIFVTDNKLRNLTLERSSQVDYRQQAGIGTGSRRTMYPE
jgi:hypothetical protein